MHVTRNRAQRLLALDGRRHVYNYIHEMGYDPASTTTVTTPLDPNIVYSQEDCPAEVDVDLRAKVWAAHGKLIHLAVWSRPDLAHAVSVLGRYVHNPSQKLWLAYHRIAKYLIRTKDFRLVYGTNDPLHFTPPTNRLHATSTCASTSAANMLIWAMLLPALPPRRIWSPTS